MHVDPTEQSSHSSQWWWDGQLSFEQAKEKLTLKTALRSANSAQLLVHAEQLVDYAMQQQSLFRAALRRIMELEAKDALGQARVMAQQLIAEYGLPEYDDEAG